MDWTGILDVSLWFLFPYSRTPQKNAKKRMDDIQKEHKRRVEKMEKEQTAAMLKLEKERDIFERKMMKREAAG